MVARSSHARRPLACVRRTCHCALHKTSPHNHGSDFAPAATHALLSGRLLCVPRIVGGINIVDLPWAAAMELNHGFSFRPGCVFHSSRPEPIRTGRKLFGAVTIKCFSGCEVKCARNYS